MDIWEADKFALFLAFIIPGFISIKAYQLAFPGTEKSSSIQLIDAIAYSSVNYAILIIPISFLEKSNLKNSCPLFYFIFYIFVFFLAPIIWVVIWIKLRKCEFLQRNAPHPIQKPWDYVFSQLKSYWIKVTLKDGTIVAGLYSTKSFVSSSPASEQIYLEESWLLNDAGGFERQKNDTAGVIILSQDISYIELRDCKGD